MKNRSLILGTVLALVAVFGLGFMTDTSNFDTSQFALTGKTIGIKTGVPLTDPNSTFQITGTHYDRIVKQDAHGISLTYFTADTATLLWYSFDNTFHFPFSFYVDNISGGSLLTINSSGQAVGVDASNPVTAFYSSGHAFLNDMVITNQLQFTTNAFPLAPGTTWNVTKHYQNIITNGDWQITAIAGLTNYAINWGTIEWSNSAAGTHFCDLSSLPWHLIGSGTTNKVYLGGGKVAFLSSNFRGVACSNLVTSAEQ